MSLHTDHSVYSAFNTVAITKPTFHFVIDLGTHHGGRLASSLSVCSLSTYTVSQTLTCISQTLTLIDTHTYAQISLSMTAYTSIEELESSVPLAQLLPSVAFGRCAAHLPHDVDSLQGDELVQSLEIALSIHSKARVVLQCWVLLILRRRADMRHEKDALYDRLQLTPVNPQEKMRYRRGAMLLCHLLVERDAATELPDSSLLDRYLVDFYFSWSSAVNEQDDAFYLQGDAAAVVSWVRQALDHLDQHGSKMTAMRWLQLSRSPTSTSAAFVPPVASSREPPPRDSLDTLLSATVSVELAPTPLALRTRRSKGSDHTLPTSAAAPASSTVLQRIVAPSTASLEKKKKKQKRRRADAFTELNSLRVAVERWAKRLRRQLLAAAMTNDQQKIRRVAEQLRAPPLLRKAAKHTRERCTVDKDHAAEQEDSRDNDEETSPASVDQSSSASAAPSVSTDHALTKPNECTVCAEEPARMEQVWNVGCQHGFCGHCMHARLSQRERKCMGCRESITQVVDQHGQVFQHFEWTRRWKQSQALLPS